ncbi:MAG TPA: hypothetical protein VFE42_31365 [Chloroflexota bacterium]|nr:hypothetical protein [Chloroflexota bacterium]
MVYRWSVDGPAEEGEETCYVRSRRLWPLGPSIVYEAVCRRGGKMEVLACSRKVPRDSPAAAASLLKLTQGLVRDGWEPTPEPRLVGPDIVASFTRPAERDRTR